MDQGSRIKDQGSRIKDQGSRIKDQGSRIKDQGSRSSKKLSKGKLRKRITLQVVRSSAPTHSSLDNEFLSFLIISSEDFAISFTQTRDLNTLVGSTKEWEICSSLQNFQDVTFHMSETLQGETLTEDTQLSSFIKR